MTNGHTQNLLNPIYRTANGLHYLKTNPNEFGEVGYQTGKNLTSLLDNEEFQKLRQAEAERAQATGVEADSLNYINHDWTLAKIREIRQESLAKTSIKNLVGILKKIDGGFNFDVHDSIADTSQLDLIQRNSNGNGLSESDQYAAQVIEYLSTIYDSLSGLEQLNMSYTQSLNVAGEKMNTAYLKKIGEFKEPEKAEA